jgi:hypothetical protein
MNHAPATAPTADQSPAARARRWLITTTDGRTESGHLPAWATDDPSEQRVPVDQLGARLADITHHRAFPGQTLRVYSPTADAAQPEPVQILRSSIDCNPHAPRGEPRIPMANVHIVDETWITDLSPDDLTDLANGLRAVADRLDHEVIPTLHAARADWNIHHPDPAPTPGPTA